MARPALAEQFATTAQQRETASLGMWIFLASEILLFGGLFTGYTVYRLAYPDAFSAASSHLYVSIGTANTAVLLTSSLTMALAVHAAQAGQRRPLIGFLAATILLGGVFLALKAVEYYLDYREGLLPPLRFEPGKVDANAGPVRLFLSFYVIMTGLHALHMCAGLTVLTILVLAIWRRKILLQNTVENTGLYWHLVDIVWIFLLPLLYLAGAS